MAVRSEDVKKTPAPQSRQTKDSAVFTRDDIHRSRSTVERAIAWVILFLSFVGSMVAFGGGWVAVVTFKPSLAGLGAGFVLQLVLTWLQWAYPERKSLAWTSRGIDAATTAAGYGPLFYGLVSELLLSQGASAETINVIGFPVVPAVVGTWCILWLFSLFPAWYPEYILIDEG